MAKKREKAIYFHALENTYLLVIGPDLIERQGTGTIIYILCYCNGLKFLEIKTVKTILKRFQYYVIQSLNVTYRNPTKRNFKYCSFFNIRRHQFSWI